MQVLSIGVLLALGVGMYSAMSSMSAWRVDSADASFALLRSHDLRVALAEGTFVDAGRLRRAARPVAGVAAAEERLVLATQVDASDRGRTVIVPGRIVGAAADAVDRVSIATGRAPAGPAEVLLEQTFAEHHGLPHAGSLRLAGGRSVRYTGHATAPEYFIVTAPGADFGAESSFAVLFTSLRSAQVLGSHEGQVNEVVVRLEPGERIAAAQLRLERALRRAVPDAAFAVTRGSDETARRLLYRDAEGDQEMLDIFAALLLAAAGLATFNLASRTVEAQRREIGIGMALGVEPRALARRPLLLAAQLGLIGVMLGLPAGVAANGWLRTVLEDFFPLPVLETPVEFGLFVRGALIGLMLPLLAAFLAVWRALRVAPVEAIRIGARSGRTSGWAGIAKGWRLPGGSLAALPLRNVLRTPRRTLMTMLGIAAIVTIVVAFAGIVDSFSGTLDSARAEALAGEVDRLVVDLAAPRAAGDPAVASIAAASTVAESQPSLRLRARLERRGRGIDAFVETVARRRPVWHPSVGRGSFEDSRPGLLIARRAAEDLGVGLGDRVTVRHPVQTAGGGSRLVSTPLIVTGIHTSPFRFVVYATPAAATALRAAGIVNRFSVVPRAGSSADDVKRELLRAPFVAGVQGAAATTDAADQRMDQFTDVLTVALLIGMGMALLIAFNTSAINADERVREHATMFAFGVGAGRVTRGTMVEAALVGAGATAAGVAGGHLVLRWIVYGVMPETMPDVGSLVAVAPATYGLAALAGLVVVAAAPLLTLRRLRAVDIPGALRVVE